MRTIRRIPLKKTRAALAFAIALLAPSALAADGRIVLIFDASISMTLPGVGGSTRLEQARKATKGLVPLLSSRQAGLVAFGHFTGGCDVEKLHAPGTADGQRIAASVDRLQPVGFTPLAQSLETAAEALAEGGRRTVPGDRILLLTDGAETCGGDPVATARSVRSRYPGVSIHVVGFSTSPRVSAQLRRIAVAGGGSIQVATGTGALQGALKAVLDGSYLPEASPLPETAGKDPILDPDTIPRELEFGSNPESGPPDLSQMEAEIALERGAPLKAAPMPKEEEKPKEPPQDLPGTAPPEPEVKVSPLL